ncbi:MAG: hypothetical protein JWM19_1584 [Actinomycetia bacterium]|nr:hypothetical protein [Actinomycetes bacterium]
MTEYPDQPRQQGRWPTQPAQYNAGTRSNPEYPPPPVRRRRRHRARNVLIGLLVLIVVLLVAADRIGVAYAQNAIATKIQQQAKLSAKPSVTIEGFPFLTQVAARDLRQVDISATNVREDNVTISQINATATGVHVNSSFNHVTVDQINGDAVITFANIAAALPAPLSTATITADPSAGPNGVNVDLGGGLATLTGQVTLTSPTQVNLHIANVGGLAGLLGGVIQHDYSFNIPTLPAGLTVDKISVNNQGIVLSAAAHDTSLSQ